MDAVRVVGVVAIALLGCGGARPSSPSGATPEGSEHRGQSDKDMHRQGRGSSNEAVTNAKMEGELRKTMAELGPGYGVQRIALADIAYPQNADENQKLGGFALLVVTAVTHEPTELPPRVRFRHSGGDLPLPHLLSRIGGLDPSDLREVFGPHRFDGLYVIPIQATQTQGTLLANFQN